jgi:hypothetical protein
MLLRLVYYSTNLVKKFVNPRDSELRKIVLSAGSTNRAASITGRLDVHLCGQAPTSPCKSSAKGKLVMTDGSPSIVPENTVDPLLQIIAPC